MVAEGVSPGGQASAALPGYGVPERIRVLLVEDDDGDALLVEELLLDAGQPFLMTRARTVAEAGRFARDVVCVLLDLELPDSRGLQGVRFLHETFPHLAVVVLTGLADEHLGEAAVAAGAQDYLAKGQVDGFRLLRVVRYAVERRRADETQQKLREAKQYAEENERLERGLLPSEVLTDQRLSIVPKYRMRRARVDFGGGGQQMLLGGDFYDVVQAPDDWVHAMVGDVSGHGPDEAALGVCLRVAWRTMIMAGRPVDETLTAVQQVLEHERQNDRLFATICMLSIAPDRTTGVLHLAGHPPPLLLTGDAVRELEAPVRLPPGIVPATDWPSAQVDLGQSWSVLMYTDGLIEGRTGSGADRLGSEGLIRLIENARAQAATEGPSDLPDNKRLVDAVVDMARELNGGDLDDDLAVLAISCALPAA
jgi:serine phosphatase RsbU (regulator of sigma subunit)